MSSDGEGEGRPGLGSGSERGSGDLESSYVEESVKCLHRLVEPLKLENARLARVCRQLRAMLQDVVAALRGFFADPDRREWFKSQTDDADLVRFFQKLVAWYRKVAENDKDPMLAFYRRIWEYERGPAEAEAEAAAAKPPQGSREPWMTSARLYDACHARTENMLLLQENDRMREETSALRERLSALERELRLQGRGDVAVGAVGCMGTVGAADAVDAGGAVGAAGADGEVDASSGQRPVLGGPDAAAGAGAGAPRPARTLQQLIAADARWRRLVEDPDGLFNPTDVIDEGYEEYLGDILQVMERDERPFREAIQLSAQTAAGLGGGA